MEERSRACQTHIEMVEVNGLYQSQKNNYMSCLVEAESEVVCFL